jgi:SARP family transcriptional regulator, regulator of embCAB operon
MTEGADRGADHVQLCGRLAATIAGRRVEESLTKREERLLFAYLVLNRLQPVEPARLIDAVWSDQPPPDGEKAIVRLLNRLRRLVGPCLELRPNVHLRLPVGSFVDVEAAAEAVHRAEAAVTRRDWTTSWTAARVGLHTARRTFLSGARAPWIDAQRNRMRGIEVRALECIAATGLGLGGNELVSTERSGRVLIEREPLRESGYRYLMEALARRGNAAEALRLYAELARRLEAEVGIGPAPETRALREQLTAGTAPAAPVDSTTRTFIFTDICGSTPLVSAIGDEAWRNLLEWHDRLITQLIHEHQGEIMDQAGDGFFAAFMGSTDAVRCAIAIQQRLATHRVEHGFAPGVRIGVHADRAVPARGKYAGRGVHTAARVAGLAGAGEIVLSAATADAAGLPLDQRRPVALKGLVDPVEVGVLRWQ